MKAENFKAIEKALKYAELQLELLVFSGDHDTAKAIAVELLEARVALYDEAR